MNAPLIDALFRIRTQFPQWRLYRVNGPDGPGWAAHGPDGQEVTAPTLPQLECELAGR